MMATWNHLELSWYHRAVSDFHLELIDSVVGSFSFLMLWNNDPPHRAIWMKKDTEAVRFMQVNPDGNGL